MADRSHAGDYIWVCAFEEKLGKMAGKEEA